VKRLILALFVSTQAHAINADSAPPWVRQERAKEEALRVRRAADQAEAEAKRQSAARHFERGQSGGREADNAEAEVTRQSAARHFERGQSGGREADNAEAEAKRQSAARHFERGQLGGREADEAAVAQSRAQSAEAWKQTDATQSLDRAKERGDAARADLERATEREKAAIEEQSRLMKAQSAQTPAEFTPKTPRGKSIMEASQPENRDRVVDTIQGAELTKANQQAADATAARQRAEKAVADSQVQEASARERLQAVEGQGATQTAKAPQATSPDAKALPSYPSFAGGTTAKQMPGSSPERMNDLPNHNKDFSPASNEQFNKNEGFPVVADASKKFVEEDFRCVYGGVFREGDKCAPARKMSEMFLGEKLENKIVHNGTKTVDITKRGCAPTRTPRASTCVRPIRIRLCASHSPTV